ncbi:MAG: META domain-containing protein [Betaproteobacteria bacterium]
MINFQRGGLYALVPLLAACAAPAFPGGENRTPTYVPATATPPAIAQVSSTFTGAVWQWDRTRHHDDRTVMPASPDRYTVSFQPGGRVNVLADCNRGTGPYEINGETIKIGPIATTKMMCSPDSKDREFLLDLGTVTRIVAGYTDRGQLRLVLGAGGVMAFTRQP